MRLHPFALAALVLMAAPAVADPPSWSHGRHHDDEGGGYARVIAVVPVYAGSRRRCYEVPNAAIVDGAVVGGVVGHEIAANSGARPGYSVECRNEGGGPPAYYDVTYRHDGRTYHRRMDHDPGTRIRIGGDGGGDHRDDGGDGGDGG